MLFQKKYGKLNLPFSGTFLLTMTAVVTFSDRFAESSWEVQIVNLGSEQIVIIFITLSTRRSRF